MAYFTYAVKPKGAFTEKEYGNPFEYSLNDDPMSWCEDFPHKVWVGDVVNNNGYRYAIVKKTVAYVCVDEDEFGLPVIEKWNILRHREYSNQGLTTPKDDAILYV